MRKSYWNCEIQRCWNGGLKSEILDNSIFCYGKPGSGKTENVANPYLRRAIQCSNSIILMRSSEDGRFNEIYELAKEAGYEFIDHTPIYYPDYDFDVMENTGEEIAERLVKRKTFLRIWYDGDKRYDICSADKILHLMSEPLFLAGETEDDDNERIMVSLLADNVGWDIVANATLGDSPYVNYCILTSCDTLRVSDTVRCRRETILGRLRNTREISGEDPLRKAVTDAAQKKDLEMAQNVLNNNIRISGATNVSNILVPENNKQRMMQLSLENMSSKELDSFVNMNVLNYMSGFFYDVVTVICTGLHGLSPAEHKDFLRTFVVPYGVKPPSGKFLITELTDQLQPLSHSVFPKTVMNVNKEPVDTLFQKDFRPGKCVIERNGVVMMYVTCEGCLVPLVFANFVRAMDWIDLYFFRNRFGVPYPAEMDTCFARFLLPTQNERGERDEISISYIQSADIPAFVDQATMIAMEVEEYLTCPDRMAEVPDLDLKGEAANISLQKIADHACRNHRRIRKDSSAELPVDEETQQEVVSMAEEYRWIPYRKPDPAEPVVETETAMEILPKKKVLFLGGHANMVKKLRQHFPQWDFLTDDELGCWTGGECDVVFFWYKHCSHLLQQYVNARKSRTTPYIYVTATNIGRLISEMAQKYKEYVENIVCV